MSEVYTETTTVEVTGHVISDMHAFHSKYGFSINDLTPKGLVNRLQFLEEELRELEQAAYNLDGAEVVDGLIDLMVVAAGTLNLLIGKDLSASAWIKIMETNNKKVIGFNSKRPNSEGMDLVKPEGWQAPELSDEAMAVEAFYEEHLTSPEAVREYRSLILENLTNVDHRARAAEPVKKTSDRYAVQVLQECIDLMRKKGEDYANPDSSVRHADYYPNGITDLVYMIDVLKRNRQTSLIEAAEKGYSPNNESLRDTLRDRLVYLAIAIEWLDKQMDGQKLSRDMFNRYSNEEVTL